MNRPAHHVDDYYIGDIRISIWCKPLGRNTEAGLFTAILDANGDHPQTFTRASQYGALNAAIMAMEPQCPTSTNPAAPGTSSKS